MKSLSIRNFKNIESLDLKGLERVNLFTGKNNTGKSSLLEAIALFVNNGDLKTIISILQNRGELPNRNGEPRFLEKDVVKIFSSLFTDNKIDFFSRNNILIEENEKNILVIRLVKFFSEVTTDDDGVSRRRRHIISESTDGYLDDVNIGLEIKHGDLVTMVPLERTISINYYQKSIALPSKGNFLYVNSGGLKIEENGVLWDNITLTDKEDYVIQGLRIIEPSIERIAFIGENKGDRNAVVKMKGKKQVLSLNSMGDGINRVLSIILAAVNAENGFLLIDEFENGLYHSVQEQLWEIIFELSSELNFQVFATTHSNDCIDGFENILNDGEENRSGKLFRLERKDHFIKNIEFDKEDLKIATDENIEIR